MMRSSSEKYKERYLKILFNDKNEKLKYQFNGCVKTRKCSNNIQTQIYDSQQIVYFYNSETVNWDAPLKEMMFWNLKPRKHPKKTSLVEKYFHRTMTQQTGHPKSIAPQLRCAQRRNRIPNPRTTRSKEHLRWLPLIFSIVLMHFQSSILY